MRRLIHTMPSLSFLPVLALESPNNYLLVDVNNIPSFNSANSQVDHDEVIQRKSLLAPLAIECKMSLLVV